MPRSYERGMPARSREPVSSPAVERVQEIGQVPVVFPGLRQRGHGLVRAVLRSRVDGCRRPGPRRLYWPLRASRTDDTGPPA